MHTDQSAAASTSNIAQSQASGSPQRGPGLHARVLPWWAMYATSVSSMAPTASLSLAIAGVALSAGNGTWLTWVIITIGVAGIGYCVSWLARRFATSGGFYGLGALTGGHAGGFMLGIPELVALLIALSALTIGGGIYLVAFLGKLGIGDSHLLNFVCYLALVAVALIAALSEIKLSTKLLLALELVSVSLICVLLLVAVFKHHGSVIDHRQLALKGFTAHHLFLAMAFATYVMAGFENSSTLGHEANRPHRDIPRSVLGTVIMVGGLYVIASYVEILLLPNGSIDATSAPLSTIATHAGIGWVSWIIDLCIAASFFSSLLAAGNTSARMIYTLAADGVLPKSIAGVSPKTGAPKAALWIAMGITALTVGAYALTETSALDAYDYVGTLSGYMFVVAYLLATAIAVQYALRTHALRALLALAALFAAATMVITIYYSFVPLPTGAYRNVFWLWIAIMVVASALLVWGIAAKPSWFLRIGNSAPEADDEDQPLDSSGLGFEL